MMLSPEVVVAPAAEPAGGAAIPGWRAVAQGMGVSGGPAVQEASAER
jgi:hypothetical protein